MSGARPNPMSLPESFLAMSAHTPGPWLIGRGADGFPIVHTAPDSFSPSGQGVAHVCKRPMTQEHTANARLIAAAPELLAALKYLVAEAPDDLDDDYNPHTAPLALARAAIAKAGG